MNDDKHRMTLTIIFFAGAADAVVDVASDVSTVASGGR
eukprot:CAMPEP_0171310300 /NCGR_PEP_ID=MMETSP0816-20121228/20499_1 /TAXON_ID=420281 /ORGANISM="Proboscia inermis, Strain CCAP1064/1" /LENGTH=37 /DNA_ID= /DNA_START= /DNA_END= /DNA_ORIENTATION=